MALIILLASVWAILGQLYFIRQPDLTRLILILSSSEHPLFWLYFVFGGIVLISLVIPIWFALTSEKFRVGLDAVVERVSVLTIFYLAIDMVAIAIVVWRNNFWLPL
jgi:hypothetical protein